MTQKVKHLPTMQETWVRSLCGEDPLEKEMATHFRTHSRTFTWKIPWMEEPGRLQSMGSQSRTRLSGFTSLATIPLSRGLWAANSPERVSWRAPGFVWVGTELWFRLLVTYPRRGEPHGQRSLTGYDPWSHRVGCDLACAAPTFFVWFFG